jgi:hypothetical protein
MAITSAPHRGGHTVHRGQLLMIAVSVAIVYSGNPPQVITSVTGIGTVTPG